MLIVRALLWILLACQQLETNVCRGQCINPRYFMCELGLINMTSDGGVLLRRAIEKQTTVSIKKLIVSTSASGPFLQKITNFVDSVTYSNYRDASFFVPSDNTISEIVIESASAMRAFVAGTNTKLATVSIEQCSLDRLPQTLPNMTKLETLAITDCKIMVLRLDLLVENQYLKILDLSNNRIRQVMPFIGRLGRTLRIELLSITNNLLEHLDMAVFASMPLLKQLYLWRNLIINVEMSTTVILPQLTDLYLGYNKIASLDIRNLTAPNLDAISLGPNALRQMPMLPRSLPKFSYISLYENNLTKLDLSFFRPYLNLKSIYLAFNQITTVKASSPVRLSVSRLELGNNQITTFNLTGCDMPNITQLILDNNRLKEVPSVFARYPKARLMMDGNPIPCNALLPFKDKLKDYQLIKDQRPLSMNCSTTSSLLIEETIKVCCDK